jgi:hypothetical protein
VKKISAAVLDVSAPFLDALPENATEQAQRDAIEMGVMVWNALALLRRGDERVWSGVTDYFRRLPEQQSATLAIIVAECVRRKNARHADDVRVVRDWKLTIGGDGTATLRAEASDLLAPLAGRAARSKRRGGG